jgi:hypothetical protein
MGSVCGAQLKVRCEVSSEIVCCESKQSSSSTRSSLAVTRHPFGVWSCLISLCHGWWTEGLGDAHAGRLGQSLEILRWLMRTTWISSMMCECQEQLHRISDRRGCSSPPQVLTCQEGPLAVLLFGGQRGLSQIRANAWYSYSLPFLHCTVHHCTVSSLFSSVIYWESGSYIMGLLFWFVPR